MQKVNRPSDPCGHGQIVMSDYLQTFINPAHQTRFLYESICYPRVKDFKRQADSAIELGYRCIGRTIGLEKLIYLDEHGKARGRLVSNIFRKDKHKTTKKWLLTTYEYGINVSFLQIDFDRHGYNKHETLEQRKSADSNFFAEIENLIKIANDLDFDIVWTTSPGDVCTEGINKGEHIHGIYAWIKFSRSINVRKLREELIPPLKKYYNINSETSFDTKNRPIRIPGQRFVEVCDPNMQLLYPYDDERPQDTANHFNTHWIDARPVDVDKLFGPALEQASNLDNQQKSTKVNTKSKEQSVYCPPAHIDIQQIKNVKETQKAYLDYDPKTINKLWSEHNTFDRYIKLDKAPSKIAWKYLAKTKSRSERWSYFPFAEDEFEQHIIKTAKPDSETSNNPDMRRKFVNRIMRHFFNTFDHSKSKSQRMMLRLEVDKQRFSYCSEISKSKFLFLMQKKCGFDAEMLKSLSLFFDKMQAYYGRIYYKLAHSIFGGKRGWDRVQKVLIHNGMLKHLDRYDMHDSKCRQYGWTGAVVGVCKKTKNNKDNNLSQSPPESISCTLPPLLKKNNDTERIEFIKSSLNVQNLTLLWKVNQNVPLN